MNSDIRKKYSMFLEDFDIADLNKNFPKQKVGVNVSRIYTQIAKYNQNPGRIEEVKILKKAICKTSNKYNYDARYAIMEINEIVFCFGKSLKKLPKSTFLLTHAYGSDD